MSRIFLGKSAWNLGSVTAVRARDCQGEAPVLTLIGLAIAGASLIATLMTVPEFRGVFFSASEKAAPSNPKPVTSAQPQPIRQPISTPVSSPFKPAELPVQQPDVPMPTPFPQATGATSTARPFGAASKSWCLGMKQQWQFRQEHFQQNDESIKVAMEEKDCGYWGLRAE